MQRFLRTIGLGAAIIFGVLALMVAVWRAWYYISYEQPASNIIGGISLLRNDLCSDSERPLFIGFINRSHKTVNAIHFNLNASYEGRSSNLLLYPYMSFTNDNIIKSQKRAGLCWPYPELAQGVELTKIKWRVTITSIDFQ